jgi:toxic protein SymE
MNEQTNTRELKVYGQSGYKYKDTATIILKGKWLENAGFKIGSSIKVSVEENQIMIKNDGSL